MTAGFNIDFFEVLELDLERDAGNSATTPVPTPTQDVTRKVAAASATPPAEEEEKGDTAVIGPVSSTPNPLFVDASATQTPAPVTAEESVPATPSPSTAGEA